jgi:hypothetical protein
MFTHTTLKRSLVVGLAVGASAFPAAAHASFIMPGDPGPGTAAVAPARASAAHRAPETARPQAGADFQWDDAGIGAAAAVALLGAGTAATVGLRRRHAHGHAIG